MDTTQFWEARAQRFAGDGDGLRAVCSYAMPGFYNWSIDLTQRAALNGVLRAIKPGDSVLEYGCGVGRWTREIARRGALVTAVDFSATMLSEARQRTARAGLSASCRFVQSDVTRLELSGAFDWVIGVTVLQHVLDDEALVATVARLGRHLKPGGRLIVVEAAPLHHQPACETATFHARPLATYMKAIAAAGLEVVGIGGVDPMPFKLWVVPRFRRWPKALGLCALALATALGLPLDLLLRRVLVRWSWHKIVVASAAESCS